MGWSRRYQMLKDDFDEVIDENVELRKQLKMERSKRVRLENEVWILKKGKKR